MNMEEQKNAESPRVAHPFEVIAVYGAAFIFAVTVGPVFAQLGPIAGTALFTLGIALIPIAFVAVRRRDFARAFPISFATRRELGASLTMTAGLVALVIVVTTVLSILFPSGTEALNDVSATILGLPDWAAVLTVAVLPAVCEEIFFRGFVLGSLRDATGKWIAILASSVLFGALHLDALRIPIAAGVGIALGYVAWETRSLVLPMIMHALYNLSLFMLSRFAAGGDRDFEGIADNPDTFSIQFPGISAGAPLTDRVLMAVNVVFILAPLVAVGIVLLRRGARGFRSRATIEGPSRA